VKLLNEQMANARRDLESENETAEEKASASATSDAATANLMHGEDCCVSDDKEKNGNRGVQENEIDEEAIVKYGGQAIVICGGQGILKYGGQVIVIYGGQVIEIHVALATVIFAETANVIEEELSLTVVASVAVREVSVTDGKVSVIGGKVNVME
jgi:hypothetical protein